jgi:hypothetical protein
MMAVLQAGMQSDILDSLTRLSDAELVVQLRSLIVRDRNVTAQIVAHLAELDTRDVHLREGYTSTKPEVGEIVARLSPRPDVPPSVRRLPASRSVSTTPPPPLVASTLTTPDPSSIPTPAPDQAVRPLSIRPAAVEPLSPDRYKLQLTIGGATLEKLRLAKDMLGHAIPSGDDAAILDRALTVLLVDLAKKKFGDTPKPGHSRGTKPGARYPAAKVRRAVWVRSRTLRLRLSGRAPMQRAPVRGVPPRRSVRPGWRGDRRPDRVAVPASQRLRGPFVLREAQTCARTCSGTSSFEREALNLMSEHQPTWSERVFWRI